MKFKIKSFLYLICVLCFVACGRFAFALGSLDTAKSLYMEKKYCQAIEEFGAVISANPDAPEILSEANYFTGASYVNLFDFLTAKKNFKAIVEKYKGSAYYEDAYLALGDVEFLQENYREALKAYTEFYVTVPSTRRMATLYFRLAEVNLKLNNRKEFNKYLGKLRQEFPQTFEAKDAGRLEGQESFYTVQVGAFTNYDNAEKFIEVLRSKGYDVYSVTCMLAGKKLCRIRVGKFETRPEAEELKKRLERDGYFAKIFP